MRIFLLLLLLLHSFSGQAQAFLDPNCEIYWKAFSLSADSPSLLHDLYLPDNQAQPPAPEASGQKHSSSVTEPSGVRQQGRVLLALTVVPPPEEYLYGPETTDGLPTRIETLYAPLAAFPMTPMSAKEMDALLRDKGEPLPVRYPAPVPKRDTVFLGTGPEKGADGDLPIYAGPLTFWTEMPVTLSGLGGVAARITLSGLLCSPVSCTPASGTLDLSWSAAELRSFPPAENEPWWDTLAAGQNVYIEPPGDVRAALSAFAEEARGNSAEKALEEAELTRQAAAFSTLDPSFFMPALEVQFLGEALFFGLLAGLLLNLMPCVLPVVSLKFSALMAVTNMTDKQEQARAFRTHCLIFSVGIMVWFLVLAFLLGVAGWAWGELFQRPVVIVILGLVLFLLGLSLFGVFSLPILNLKISSDSHPHWQSFASGLLATLLATPCSGPLLGGVLAWAIRQPLPILVLAVASVGLGMCLPYCVLALCPRLVHLVPRPGTWTIRLEQLLGFFLMGSVVYLTTLLPGNWIPAFLFNLFAVAFAAWLWGQIGHLRASRFRRMFSRAIAVFVLFLSATWGYASINPDRTWEVFDPQTFLESLGKESMLLDFTADWCPSCKALEHTTLNKARMDDLRRRYNVRTIRVDITRNAAAGRELLRALDSTSIPVLALFPKGDKAKQPVVLRDLVTPAQLEEAASATYGASSDFSRLRKALSTENFGLKPASAHP